MKIIIVFYQQFFRKVVDKEKTKRKRDPSSKSGQKTTRLTFVEIMGRNPSKRDSTAKKSARMVTLTIASNFGLP